MVRVAEAQGGLRFFGFEAEEDATWEMTIAIDHASRILGWRANLTHDEMPPEWMWPFEDKLEEWFADVEEARKDRTRGGDTREEAPMMQNEFTKDFERR